jgi:hypothetical protein
MNISKTTLKYYGIPAVVAVFIILIVLAVPIKKPTQTVSPTLTPSPIVLPTVIYTSPTPGPSPTLTPPRFTGAEDTQEVPQPLYELGSQKTNLRRQTPLTLPFGTISFDYENDLFTVQLSTQTAQQDFETWRQTSYPAIPASQFVFSP